MKGGLLIEDHHRCIIKHGTVRLQPITSSAHWNADGGQFSLLSGFFFLLQSKLLFHSLHLAVAFTDRFSQSAKVSGFTLADGYQSGRENPTPLCHQDPESGFQSWTRLIQCAPHRSSLVNVVNKTDHIIFHKWRAYFWDLFNQVSKICSNSQFCFLCSSLFYFTPFRDLTSDTAAFPFWMHLDFVDWLPPHPEAV